MPITIAPTRCSWLLPALILALAAVAGCARSPMSSSPSDLREKAAAEATAIVQSAEATAMVMQAQARATALLQAANDPPPAIASQPPQPESTAAVAAVVSTRVSPAAATPTHSPSPTAGAAAPDQDDAPEVQLVGVSIGAESGLILVQFKALPSLARKWQQGMVYVVDEATATQYVEIPVMPIVGPLFGRPRTADQLGYVMLVNAPPGLHPGSLVTVVLGDFKQEHVAVR